MLKNTLTLLCWLFLWMPASYAGDLASQVQHLDRAQLSAVPPDGAKRADIQLPDSWNKSNWQGTWDYALAFTLPSMPTEPWGVYLPRVGNRFSIQLNGHVLAQLGLDQGVGKDYAQKPHYFFLPPDYVRAGPNQLVVRVQGDQARYAGLSTVWVGPAEELHGRFVLREVLQTWGSFSVILIAIVFGLISAGLAYTTRDQSFAIFAAACAFCAVRTSYAVVTGLPFHYSYWHLLINACYAGYFFCLAWFCTRLLQIQRAWLPWLTYGFMAVTLILLPWFAFKHNAMARQLWLLLMIVYALCICGLVLHAWYVQRSTAARVLGWAALASVALSVYDHSVVFYTADGYGSMSVARFSLLIFLVAMGWVLVERGAQQVNAERNFRKQLAMELGSRTQELSEQFKKQELLIAQAAHHEEHKRLMQDLHDSMGLQLNALLVMAEKGGFSQSEMTSEVRTTIEQMRMLVDGAQTFDGDFGELLGHIRYRIESRLRRCDIGLQWHADFASLQPKLSDIAGTALQRLIFELSTNVIKHSKATQVRMHIAPMEGQPRMLQMEFSDNGTGLLASENPYGIGTTTLRLRLSELNATATQVSTPQGGLKYHILLPC
jgi:signal transduction histidine kinase